MIKLLSMILALLLVTMPAFGESVELSELSLEELTSLRDRIDTEIVNRSGEPTQKGYSGVFISGKNIKKGSYIFECRSENVWLFLWNSEQKYMDSEYPDSDTYYAKGNLISVYFDDGTVAKFSGGAVDIRPATEDWAPKE